ncbi:hypothetical protein Ancab_039596 [Ancistrocladus abbreviatus]
MHIDPSIIWSAAQWIGTQVVNEVKFLLGVEGQARELESQLRCLALHLRKADSGEEGDDDDLRVFTTEIREISFRAEDVVDNYILKFASSSSTNVCGNCLEKSLRILCNCLDIHFIGKDTVAIRNGIQAAVDRLIQFRSYARFIAPEEGSNQPRRQPRVMQAYPHTEDACVVGRDDDVKDLVRQLTEHEKVKVVAIVGAGGLGKKT